MTILFSIEFEFWKSGNRILENILYQKTKPETESDLTWKWPDRDPKKNMLIGPNFNLCFYSESESIYIFYSESKNWWN